MKKSVLIFDFDGTMVQSFGEVVEIIDRQSAKFGLQPLADREIEKFRQGTNRHLYTKEILSRITLPWLLKQVIKEQAKDIGQLKEVDGIFKLLKTLKKRGIKMGIVSSNSSENVMAYLKKHKISHLFDFVYSAQGLFNKADSICKMISDHNLNAAEVVYVGDETRDIEAAKKAGVKVIAVSWGYQTAEALKVCQPDWLVASTEEFFKIATMPHWQQMLLGKWMYWHKKIWWNHLKIF